MLWVVAVAALGLVVASTASYLVLRNLTDTRIDDALAQEVAELRAFAAEGVDPETGESFTDIADLFYTALQRNVPDRNEGFLTFVDGEVAFWSPGDRLVRLQELPEVVALGAQPVPDRVRFETVPTDIGDVRLAIVPVRVDGDPRTGAYVVGFGRDLEQAEVRESAVVLAVVGALSLALVALVAWVVSGRLLRPLRSLRETAQHIGESDLTQRIEVTGHDDVSELARTFNSMLDRLEGAFGAQRELLDDVGHELRTPITVVRGHIELMDAGDPDDVAATRTLVLDELDRMNRLVEDLIVLAKVRRPDFLRTSAVDLDPFLDEVLDKAGALAPRLWTLDERSGVTITADRQRLTQALLQLISNAVRHTHDGGSVGIGSRRQGDRVLLWVRDDGPGVPEAERTRIFRRFARARSSEGTEGTGLGLAIVSAICEAHGGRISVTDAPGGGALFVLDLPLTAVVDEHRDDDRLDHPHGSVPDPSATDAAERTMTTGVLR
jgi:signal transduction histidine kinase